MSMSRKQYRDMAAVIKEVGDYNLDSAEAALEAIASGLATVFVIDNPRFDRARFLEACGIEQQ